MEATLSRESALSARLAAWMKERFPPIHSVLAVVLYAAAALAGRALAMTASGAGRVSVLLTGRDLLGLPLGVAFFLMLRVFDEHKDFELDVRNHPQRVLSRGLITLGHLKVVGAIAIALQLAMSLALDRGGWRVTACWGVTMAWALLMGKEFFIGDWLKPRLLLYAVSHMIVMPLALVWMAQSAVPWRWVPGSVAWLAGLGLASGFALEVARKLKAPADERDGVDSYTRTLGLRGAPVTVIALGVAQAGVLAGLLHALGAGAAWLAGGAAIALLPVLGAGKFLREPTAKAAKGAEGAVGGALLLSYVLVIVFIVVVRGVQWM